MDAEHDGLVAIRRLRPVVNPGTYLCSLRRFRVRVVWLFNLRAWCRRSTLELFRHRCPGLSVVRAERT